MNKAKQAEQARVEAAKRRQAEWLAEHKAWNWNWPGQFGSQRNCWFTNAPVRRGPSEPYSGPTDARKKKRATRRSSKRLSGMKFGRAHTYPARTVGRDE